MHFVRFVDLFCREVCLISAELYRDVFAATRTTWLGIVCLLDDLVGNRGFVVLTQFTIM